MAKKSNWPAKLRKPFPSFAELTAEARRIHPNNDVVEEAANLFFEEVTRRVMAMAAFVDPLGEGPPTTERDWIRVIYFLCRHWDIPAFSEGKAGRPKEWTDEKRLQLYIDVTSLVERRGMSERSACFHIAGNSQKKYPNDGPKTLLREFQRTKNQLLAMRSRAVEESSAEDIPF